MEDDRRISVERICLADLRVHRETHKDRERLRFRQDRVEWRNRQEKRDAEVRETGPVRYTSY